MNAAKSAGTSQEPKMLNTDLLKKVLSGFEKSAFVPGDPAAMGGGDPAAMGGDPAMMGGDPAAMAGGDPAAMAAMGGDPAAMAGGDPAAMGMPPPGLDPAMAGMVGAPPADPAAAGAMPGGATITCTLDDLAKFMQKVLAIKNSGGIEAPQQNNDMAEIRQALTQIATSLQNNGGQAVVA